MTDQEERCFSQSSAVTRCRSVKEEKLKSSYAIIKFLDEEVLEETRHHLRTQLFEERADEVRQSGETSEFLMNQQRKQQMVALVDKLTTLKKFLRFQEEAREREFAFKSSMRNKRSAFQSRMGRLEQRQHAERNELVTAQQRLANTVAQVRIIEVSALKDANKARRMKKENEVLAQQTQMKHQKEAEFLREIQLCKARHLAALNDLDIDNAEEMEELTAQHKMEEFELTEKQLAIECQAASELEKQKTQLESNENAAKKKAARVQLLRAQRRQLNSLNKARKVAARTRERMMLAENPLILGDRDDGDHSFMESNPVSQMGSQSDVDALSSNGGDDLTEVSIGDDIGGEVDASREAAVNSEANRKVSGYVSEDQRVLNALLEQGRDKLRNIMDHHRAILHELRAQHKNIVNLKSREHRRKMQDLLKEQEEEIENIKSDQAQVMADLLTSQTQKNDQIADTEMSHALLGMMLPAHVLEDLDKGITPQPSEFENVTIFFTDIAQFKSIVSRMDPANVLKMLNVLYTKFDEILARYDRLFKVECVADTYMVVAGLRPNKTREDVLLDTETALKCVKDLKNAAFHLKFEGLPDEDKIQVRVGVHTGSVLAGLIGTKMSRYCLFGDSVNTASRMCTTSEPCKVQVSPTTWELMKTNKNFEFQERGEVNVKGKGVMITAWLKTVDGRRISWVE
ncbi:Nitrogen permease regulator 2 [Blyttiomyces sp. JEL0837]|nr:Nitrogen permease regulator 2 [Blyttiomyces sp. JEL0837]